MRSPTVLSVMHTALLFKAGFRFLLDACGLGAGRTRISSRMLEELLEGASDCDRDSDALSQEDIQIEDTTDKHLSGWLIFNHAA